LRHQYDHAKLARVSSCHVPTPDAGGEIDVNHGIVDALAFQEALLIEAIFGIAILAMIWVGFRRWLQHKEKSGRLVSEQMAELAAQYGADMERVEARLNAIEQIVTDGGAKTPVQIDHPARSRFPNGH
jgi:hypothetical protein